MKGAIVTGSAKGLGKEIALMLAREGYAVAINYRKSKKQARETLKVLKKMNRNCISVKADVAEEKGARKLIGEARKKLGRIDVLVNNAGDFLYKPLLKTTKKEMMNVIENNLASAFLCSKEAMPLMQKQKGGRIINIGSSGCDEMVTPQMTTAYYIGKTGVWMLTKAMAKAAPPGVTVNMVSPGILETSVVKKKGVEITSFGEVKEAVAKLVNGNSNGRIIRLSRWRPKGQ